MAVIQGRGFVGELLAAWVVAFFVLAVGFAVVSIHAPGARDPVMPRWYESPVAVIAMWEDESLHPGATDVASRPTGEPICNIIARSASYGRVPGFGAFAPQWELPC